MAGAAVYASAGRTLADIAALGGRRWRAGGGAVSNDRVTHLEIQLEKRLRAELEQLSNDEN
jgi:hypothetical protein